MMPERSAVQVLLDEVRSCESLPASARVQTAPLPRLHAHAAHRRSRASAPGRGRVPRRVGVVAQDEPGDAMFVIIAGRVKVVMFGESGREVTLSLLARATSFGEMSLFDNGRARRNCVAIEPTHAARADPRGAAARTCRRTRGPRSTCSARWRAACAAPTRRSPARAVRRQDAPDPHARAAGREEGASDRRRPRRAPPADAAGAGEHGRQLPRDDLARVHLDDRAGPDHPARPRAGRDARAARKRRAPASAQA